MPTFEGVISAEELIQLIGYLRTLAPNETPPRVERFPPPVQAGDLPGQKIPTGAVPTSNEPEKP